MLSMSMITVSNTIIDFVNGGIDVVKLIPALVMLFAMLAGLINDYKKEANKILVSAKNIDNNFKFSFEDIDGFQATLSNDILETRDRLVK